LTPSTAVSKTVVATRFTRATGDCFRRAPPPPPLLRRPPRALAPDDDFRADAPRFAVDFRADDLRAVDLRAVDFRAAPPRADDDLRAVDFRADDLRADDFRADDFRADDFRADDDPLDDDARELDPERRALLPDRLLLPPRDDDDRPPRDEDPDRDLLELLFDRLPLRELLFLVAMIAPHVGGCARGSAISAHMRAADGTARRGKREAGSEARTRLVVGSRQFVVGSVTGDTAD